MFNLEIIIKIITHMSIKIIKIMEFGLQSLNIAHRGFLKNFLGYHP